MPTFLFNDIIFGPIRSRRLGISLGINLLPLKNKFCNFNCIYCECGWTLKATHKAKMFDKEHIMNVLEQKLQEMIMTKELPDVITFAGNGEPTLHTEFKEIIDETIILRNKYTPKTRVAVLTNGTLAFKPKIFEALNKIDDCIIKLDGGKEETIRLIDNPLGKFNLGKYVEDLKKFESRIIIQTLFLKGEVNNISFDNSSEDEVVAWLKLIDKIKPRLVMLYSIDRDTPLDTLHKISVKQLNHIAKSVHALGIPTQVADK